MKTAGILVIVLAACSSALPAPRDAGLSLPGYDTPTDAHEAITVVTASTPTTAASSVTVEARATL